MYFPEIQWQYKYRKVYINEAKLLNWKHDMPWNIKRSVTCMCNWSSTNLLFSLELKVPVAYQKTMPEWYCTF